MYGLRTATESKVVLLPPTTTCHGPGIFVRLSLATFEFTVFHYVALSSGVFIVGLLFAGMIHLWLESTQLFDDTRVESKILKYRELQVFEKLLNAFTAARIFPVLVSTLPAMEILGVFALVRLHGGMDTLQLAFIAAETLIVTGFTLVFFSGPGKIYSGSVKWLRDCKAGENRGVNRKVLASWTPLKIRFSKNFVDELTPLILQQFCTIQMVNLLLVF